MKRYSGFLIVLILLGLCNYAYASETKKRIAVLVPQSGIYAEYGALQMQGYSLAETLNAKYLNDIEIQYFDIGKTKDVKSFIKNEVLPFKPDIIIGSYSSKVTSQLVGTLANRREPLIIPSATLDSLTQSPIPNIFRVSTPTGSIAKLVSSFIVDKRPDADSVFVLAEDSMFARSAVETMAGSLNYKQIPVTTEFYTKTHLKDSISRIAVTKKSVLIAISRSVQDCIFITKQFKDKCTVIGAIAGFATPEYKTFAEQYGAGVYLVKPWDNTNPIQDITSFKQAFVSKYKDAFHSGEPEYHNVQSYSSLNIAIQTLLISKKENNPNLISILRNTEYSSPLGVVKFINFDKYYQQNPSSAVICKMQNGASITVYPVSNAKIQTETSGSKKGKTSSLKILFSNQIIALFVICGLGLLLGNIKFYGISLGSSGVLFIALLFGHFNFSVPSGIGTIGLVFFVYCIGINAGRGFFRAFAKQGATLAKLSATVVTVGAILTCIMAKTLHISYDLAVGIFAGALTSTPALAAAMDVLKEHGPLVSIGYGIGYPFGVIGVVLFVQIFPRILRKDLDAEAKKIEGPAKEKNEIIHELVEITNASISGTKIHEAEFLSSLGFQITSVLKDGKLIPVDINTELQKGELYLVFGPHHKMDKLINLIGKKSDKAIEIDLEKESRQMVVTASDIFGKPLEDLKLLEKYGITISTITRSDLSFVPTAKTELQPYDILTAVGNPKSLDELEKPLGHSPKAMHKTDLISLSICISIGIILGLIPFSLPGGKGIALGMAGGPLIVGLLMGHFGRIGKLVGYVPPASRMLLSELGLLFFLAHAGSKAGRMLLPVIQEHGIILFAMGMIITAIPMMLAYIIATYVMKQNILQTLGGICGGMTSTPALGALASKTDSEVPVISYAAAYPVALILMTLAAQAIISYLQ